jgi:GAF domain-containing protein
LQKPAHTDLELIARVFAGGVGEDLLRTLATELAVALDAEYVTIGQLTGQSGDSIETLAFYSQGKIAANINYSLENTPCANVVSSGVCVYPSNVQRDFPEDLALHEMGVEAYLGTPLADSLGRVLGLASVMSTRPFADVERARTLLRIFAARAALELERMRLDRHLLNRLVREL